MPRQEYVGSQPKNIFCVSKCVPTYFDVNPAIITFFVGEGWGEGAAKVLSVPRRFFFWGGGRGSFFFQSLLFSRTSDFDQKQQAVQGKGFTLMGYGVAHADMKE